MTAPSPSAPPQPAWPALPLGTPLRIVKLAPDGSEVTSYPGIVIEAGAPSPWIAIRARWVSRPHDLNGLLFLPGDTLHEFFSPAHWFNLFSVFAPDGTLRGWYANVTYPSRLDPTTDPYTLHWHDLYVDVVALPGGGVVVRDEDELDEAGLSLSDPRFHALILAARDELLQRHRLGAFPFHERDARPTS
jgi:hypothetical protein